LQTDREVILMKTTVTKRGQTVIPAKVRLAHRITTRMKLEWVDDGQTIRVVPLPEDPIAAARGTSKGLRVALLTDRRRERRRG
jgi:bifunctional DNA-binding transcriptional regulator/antitoxin component of YhaV-PrlF toxin-antitoxin module